MPQHVISHVTVGTNDPARSAAFYDAVMPLIGFARLPKPPEKPPAYARPDDPFPTFYVYIPEDGRPATWGNGFHLAFMATGRDQVARFHQAAMAAGGLDDGTPGQRSNYSDDYYAAYARDPDGNKLQLVFYESGRRTGPDGDVFSHITLGTNDRDRARDFYSATLAPLGLVELPDQHDDEAYAFGTHGTELPIIYAHTPYDGLPATWGNGSHVALIAPSRKAVHEFHKIALSIGGIDAGAPGPRPHYGETYYAAYIRDPDGNKLQAVCYDQQ